MAKTALIRKGGAWIDISEDGQIPLPGNVLDELERRLQYDHVKVIFGAGNKYDAAGSRHTTEHERRQLYTYDDLGRFACFKGFYPKVKGILEGFGYTPLFIDKDPPKRPEIYEANWERVFDRFRLRAEQDTCLAQIDMHDNGVIVAPPAFGKTHIMAMVANLYPKAKIDIVTKRKDVVGRILQQLTETIANVGQIGGGKHRDGRVTVYTADSLHRSDYKADILLADECFPAGTRVDGQPIESIIPGDLVWSCNAAGYCEWRRVIRKFVRKATKLVRVSFGDGLQLVCTPNHPIFTAFGYVPAAELSAGSQVIKRNASKRNTQTVNSDLQRMRAGCNHNRQASALACQASTGSEKDQVFEWLGVDSVEILESGCGRTFGGLCSDGQVYNLEVEGNHNYFADDILVHNCHELMTDRMLELLARYEHSRNFGFTATPDTRLDGAHANMEGLFGPPIFVMTQQQAEKHQIVVPVMVQWVDVQGENIIAPYKTLVAKKRNGIWRNMSRNCAIATAAQSYLAQGMQVLVLVDTVDHALHLRRCLPEAKLCYAEGQLKEGSEKREFYIRNKLLTEEDNMTAARRVELRKQFERREVLCVIATGVWAVGVSFDSLNVLIRADGGDSETLNVQMPGRVCRIDPETNKESGILVDMNDIWSPYFRSRSANRRRDYHARGWTQVMQDGTVWQPTAKRQRGNL